MKRAIIVVVILAAAGAGVWYFKRGGEDANAASNTPAATRDVEVARAEDRVAAGSVDPADRLASQEAADRVSR